MSASMTVRVDALVALAKKLNGEKVQSFARSLPSNKSILALIGQAIEDNFDKEGPGWTPLKAQTIRYSISTKVKRLIAKNLGKKWKDVTDSDLLAHEKQARKSGDAPGRKILHKTGTLEKSATIPGADGNIHDVSGTKIIWGTKLAYAGAHNNGFPKNKIPQREFLVIRQIWTLKIQQYVAQLYAEMLRRELG